MARINRRSHPSSFFFYFFLHYFLLCFSDTLKKSGEDSRLDPTHAPACSKFGVHAAAVARSIAATAMRCIMNSEDLQPHTFSLSKPSIWCNDAGEPSCKARSCLNSAQACSGTASGASGKNAMREVASRARPPCLCVGADRDLKLTPPFFSPRSFVSPRCSLSLVWHMPRLQSRGRTAARLPPTPRWFCLLSFFQCCCIVVHLLFVVFACDQSIHSSIQFLIFLLSLLGLLFLGVFLDHERDLQPAASAAG